MNYNLSLIVLLTIRLANTSRGSLIIKGMERGQGMYSYNNNILLLMFNSIRNGNLHGYDTINSTCV